MSSDEGGPKLLNNKPKKSKLKASTTITMSTTPPPPPLPPPPKESFVKRYKFLWPLLLAVNFSIGAYVLTRTRSKNKTTSDTEVPDAPTTTATPTVATATVTPPIVGPTPTPIMKPVERAPIPEDQQRELFKWMLEEKRKVKPRDDEEKKRIDEDKAILKQFIRAKSIPSL